ncbi:MFS transporter [Actinoplanes sp. CA-142083]|uniref:MFS transporter n=1 Tax=Actinoplanes sp. CA-142083 TaxID=3239903 RepID=UPI003D90A3CB
MSAATYRDVFAEPRFRGLFAARTVWMAAGTLQILTMSVVVYRETGSPLLGALAFGAGFLPQVVSGLLLGASADRFPPRRLILGGYLVEACVAATLALLHPPVGLALALIAAVGLLAPLSNGATGRLVADALTGDAYVLGRAAISMSSSGAQLVGLAAGGVAVAALGPRNALLAACAGHLLAVLIFRLTAGRGDPPVEARSGTVLRESWSGARRLLADPPVRRLLFAQWLPPAFSTGGEALLVPYASSRGWPATTAGIMLAAVPLGMLVGDLLVSRLVRPATRERLVPLLIAVIGVPLTLLAVRPSPVVAVGLLVVAGFGLSYLLGLQRPFLDAVPEEGRGQAFTLLSTGMMTLQGIGPLLGGLAAEALGPAPVMALAGVAILIVAVGVRRENRLSQPSAVS